MTSSSCSICFDNYEEDEVCVLNCQHRFHSKCILRWRILEHQENCPLCRTFIVQCNHASDLQLPVSSLIVHEKVTLVDLVVKSLRTISNVDMENKKLKEENSLLKAVLVINGFPVPVGSVGSVGQRQVSRDETKIANESNEAAFGFHPPYHNPYRNSVSRSGSSRSNSDNSGNTHRIQVNGQQRSIPTMRTRTMARTTTTMTAPIRTVQRFLFSS